MKEFFKNAGFVGTVFATTTFLVLNYANPDLINKHIEAIETYNKDLKDKDLGKTTETLQKNDQITIKTSDNQSINLEIGKEIKFLDYDRKTVTAKIIEVFYVNTNYRLNSLNKDKIFTAWGSIEIINGQKNDDHRSVSFNDLKYK